MCVWVGGGGGKCVGGWELCGCVWACGGLTGGGRGEIEGMCVEGCGCQGIG